MSSNRAEALQAALYWGAVAVEAERRARAARDVLDAEARAEHARDGVAPTWRIPGLGTVPLGVAHPSARVTDPEAWTGWVAQRHPTEVEETVRVRPSWERPFLAAFARRGGCTEDGEVPPGLEYSPGGEPRGISIRADPTAVAQATRRAQDLLDDQAAGDAAP